MTVVSFDRLFSLGMSAGKEWMRATAVLELERVLVSGAVANE